MNTQQKRAVVIAAVIIGVLVIVLFGIFGRNSTQNTTEGPSPTLATAKSTPTPTPTPTVDAPLECPADPHPLEGTPVKFVMLNHENRELPMLSLGEDSSGAAAAPPGNESHTVGWFNEGPMIGSDKGKVVLTSHTYQWGGALGNELMDGLWEPGDIMLIEDSNGDTACYRYTEAKHIEVATYDPASDLVYDWEDPSPKFALVVCSDYTPTGDTLGRMVYYGELVRGA